MSYSIRKYMRLFIAILLSVLALSTYDIYPEQDYNKDLDLLRVGGPGVFYSIYLISCIRRRLALLVKIGIFILLFTLWGIAFAAALASGGEAVIFLGAINASFVKAILFHGEISPEKERIKYSIRGGLCGLTGYALFLVLMGFSGDNFAPTFGSTMIGIVLFWQLGLGLLIEKQKAKTSQL
ncbi:MAG: hypothetical protein AAGD28_00840 [Bacteroidota bacterium]